tara:strand:+ start:265 stop:1194 length:930 start_codon:yes stop_codon:yes gene_type:complete
MSQLLKSSEAVNILFNPKHRQSIIDFKLKQKKKEISIIGSSRTSGFEKEMFSNESVYNYALTVNSITDIKNLIIDLNLSNGDTVVLGLDQWNFNSSYNGRLLNYYKLNNINIPNTLLDDRKKTSDYLLIGDKAIENFSGFKNDGSYFYGKRLIVPKKELKDYLFRNTYSRIQKGNKRFEYGSEVDLKQIKTLEELLLYAQKNKITLVGFFPPFAPSVNEMMNNPKYEYSYINESSKLITHLFDSFGFKFSDLTKIDLFEDSFYLDGYHSNRNIDYYILQVLGISVNSNFKNEFEISKQEKITLNNYFTD